MQGSEPLLVAQGARAIAIVIIVAGAALATLILFLRLAVSVQRREDAALRAQAEHQLAATLRRVERDRFYAALLAEVRNPLSRLRESVTDLTVRCHECPHAAGVLSASRDVDRLWHLSSRIATLVGAARSYPRVDADLTEAARAAMDEHRPAAARRDVALILDAPVPVPCTLSLESIRDAVGELLDNAIRASVMGARIEVRVVRAGGLGRVEVLDYGPGIPLEHREAAFDPRARHVRGPLGDGFGLAIAREAARAHGGNVFVDAQDGAGAKLVLEIPAA